MDVAVITDSTLISTASSGRAFETPPLPTNQGPALHYVQLLWSSAQAGNTLGASPIRKLAGADPSTLSLLRDRLCGDARACPPAAERTRRSFAGHGAPSSEAVAIAHPRLAP